MYNKQVELDTINREHMFMMVGDPVSVNRFDNHELHIEEHKSHLSELKEKDYEDVKLKEFEIQILEAHIALHEEFKESK